MLVFRLQRVRARESYFAADRYGSLKLEIRLPQDQDVVKWLERHFSRAFGSEGKAWRPDVAAERIAVEQVCRVHRHANCKRELAAGAIRWEPRHFGLLQVRPDLRAVRHQHEVDRKSVV